MDSSDRIKVAGCWSGLRALLGARNRTYSQNTNTIGGETPAQTRKHRGSSEPIELPPAYQSTLLDGRHCSGWSSLTSKGVVPTTFEAVGNFPNPEAAGTSDQTIDGLNKSLRELNLSIHDHPELKWDVHHAHDVLTQFMEEQGFCVTRHYLADELPGNTAWRGEFSLTGKPGEQLRVIGFNSEMDALPGVGHACGHNLIAIIGVAAALGLKSAMEKHKIPGKIVILGTPAEEGGKSGKECLLRAGAYQEMDVCLMAHPGPGDRHMVSTPRSLAVQSFTVEYHGQTAHAGAAPWEGKNALDAAFIAYAALSALRQQIHPSARVHGMIEGRDWAPNIIPDYAKMQYFVRAPSWEETLALRSRVNKCFEAAALATGCTMNVIEGNGLKNLNQNAVLSDDFAAIMSTRYQRTFVPGEETSASTDFGNVTFELPSIHPGFSIPTVPGGGNHTPAFTAAASTQDAHDNAVAVSKGLAAVGLHVLIDERFLHSVKDAYKSSVHTRV